jgi:putative ABC transport system substrate-binding protein
MNGVQRRHFAIACTVLLAELPSAVAMQAGKRARIGFLVSEMAGDPRGPEAFRHALRALGYVDGRNLTIEFRSAEGNFARLAALAAELVSLPVDVIVASNTPAAIAAKHATALTPIVFIGVGDPVTSGLVVDLAKPGGNVTGLSVLSTELVGKWLELLRQAVQGVSRVAVLWQPGAMDQRTEHAMFAGADGAARTLGLSIRFVAARGPSDLERSFEDIAREQADALAIRPAPMFLSERRRIIDLAARNRLPAVYAWREFADAGGLLAYGPNLADLNQRAALYVDKIIRGAKPNDLPVEQPAKFDLVVNLKTAKELGIPIAPAVLVRADRIIQ